MSHLSLDIRKKTRPAHSSFTTDWNKLLPPCIHSACSWSLPSSRLGAGVHICLPTINRVDQDQAGGSRQNTRQHHAALLHHRLAAILGNLRLQKRGTGGKDLATSSDTFDVSNLIRLGKSEVNTSWKPKKDTGNHVVPDWRSIVSIDGANAVNGQWCELPGVWRRPGHQDSFPHPSAQDVYVLWTCKLTLQAAKFRV